MPGWIAEGDGARTALRVDNGKNAGARADGVRSWATMDPLSAPESRGVHKESGFDFTLGYSLLRLTLGLNFLFHSYGRWLDLGKFVGTVANEFAHLPLPGWSVRAFALAIPFWEPAVGLLLVLGLWTRWALVAGALLIASLTFGTALRGEYPVLSEQLVYALTFFVLLACRARGDRFGVDGWLRGRGTLAV